MSRKVQVENMNIWEKCSGACSVITAFKMQRWRPQATAVCLLLTVGKCGAGMCSQDPKCAGSTRVIRWRRLHPAVRSCGGVWSCLAIQPLQKYKTLYYFHKSNLSLTYTALDDHYPELCPGSVLHLALRLPACRCERGKLVHRTVYIGGFYTEGLQNSYVCQCHQLWLEEEGGSDARSYFTCHKSIIGICLSINCFKELWSVCMYSEQFQYIFNLFSFSQRCVFKTACFIDLIAFNHS